MQAEINCKIEEYDVTPWRSRNEWQEVCDLICTNQLPKLQEAYDKLRCWKARCDRLPAGIECTMVILEPVLAEQRLRELNDDFVIKSVFALAITRFLNTAASFNKEKIPASLYKIAESLKIGEWIVNIRHEAAHGPDLPPMDVLKAGVQFSLQWLSVIYWERGLIEGHANGDIITEYNLRDNLQKWSEAYQAVYLQKMMASDGSLLIDNEITSEEFPSSLNLLMDHSVRILNSIYSEAKGKGYGTQDFVKYFLEVSEFVPSKNALQKYKSLKDETGQGTTWHMKMMWAKVIKDVFQSNGILLELLNQLICINSEDHVYNRIASYWVRDIARGIRLAQISLQAEEFSLNNVRQVTYYTCEQERALYKKAKRKFVNSSLWNSTIKLSLNNIPKTDELTENVILSPRKYCRLYLTDLLETLEHQLTENKKEKIKKLIDLILNHMSYVGDRVHFNDAVYGQSDAVVTETDEHNGENGLSSAWKGVLFGSTPSREVEL